MILSPYDNSIIAVAKLYFQFQQQASWNIKLNCSSSANKHLLWSLMHINECPAEAKVLPIYSKAKAAGRCIRVYSIIKTVHNIFMIDSTQAAHICLFRYSKLWAELCSKSDYYFYHFKSQKFESWTRNSRLQNKYLGWNRSGSGKSIFELFICMGIILGFACYLRYKLFLSNQNL